jgi:hypothetical protein
MTASINAISGRIAVERRQQGMAKLRGDRDEEVGIPEDI